MLGFSGLRGSSEQRGIRGSIVSFAAVAHHWLPLAYVPHSGSGDMETATQLLLGLGITPPGAGFEGTVVHGERG